jgi:hypothetical protein
MESTAPVESERQRVVEQMLQLGPMRRGTLNEQHLIAARKGPGKPATRGPYYVLSRKEGGKTVSRRVHAEDVERVRQEIARYSRFMELCREFAELSERLGEAENGSPSGQETLKKTPNLRSRRTRK